MVVLNFFWSAGSCAIAPPTLVNNYFGFALLVQDLRWWGTSKSQMLDVIDAQEI